MDEITTQNRLFDAAYALMVSKGYAATSVSDICAKAGVSKGSFYHFFESKQRCAIEMIRHHIAEVNNRIAAELDLTGLDGIEAAIRYVEYSVEISEELLRDGCLIGVFALELAETHPELRREVSSIFRQIVEDDARILRPLAESSRRPDAPSAEELAETMLMLLEGGVVLSKAHGEPAYITKALRCFLHYVQTLRATEELPAD